MNTLTTDAHRLDEWIPYKNQQCVHWPELSTTAMALQLSQLIKEAAQPICCITPDIPTALRLQEEISAFLQHHETPILFFPDWEILPYDQFSPSEHIVSERLGVLAQLKNLRQGIVLIAATTLLHQLAPRRYIEQSSLVLKTQQTLDINLFKSQLIAAGYQQSHQVWNHGEFTMRGSLLDIFPMGSSDPYRLDFFGEQLESIRIFDPETQLSLNTVDEIHLLPAHEFPLDEEHIKYFRQRWRDEVSGNPNNSPIYQGISQGHAAAGCEYYLSLFFEKLETFFDYLSDNAIIIRYQCNNIAEQFWEEIKTRHHDQNIDQTRPLLSPEKIFIPPQIVWQHANRFKQIITTPSFPLEKAHPFPQKFLEAIVIDQHNTKPLQAFREFLNLCSQRILIVAESAGRKDMLREILKDLIQNFKSYDDWESFLNDENPQGMLIAPWQEGFVLSEKNIVVLTEKEILGHSHHVLRRTSKKTKFQDPNTLIYHLTELEIGSLIVHIDHGVGQYIGLQKLTINNIENEFLVLSYADNDKLYVPVTSLNLISRFTGGDTEHTHLNKLGNDLWAKQKNKAYEQIRDIAASLLALYAKRQAAQSIALPPPDSEYYRFSAKFAFNETDDQQKTIADVLADLQQTQPMDRIVCGDVGFGKTEVAMRAAFLAAHNQQQVAIFAPTTLLAEQHYQNFCNRFSDWPLNIAILSRFKNQKEKKIIYENLKNGKIDIIIGTHQLLNPAIEFKSLGLLIIDEEHRFGVQHKERIKVLANNVHILTLTATPIPRTLNMALSGLRSISLMTTPPAKRLPIKTFVREFRFDLIREAITRELMRGGQVYFIHNNIDTIQRRAADLQELAPNSKIAVAHGQLPAKSLERIMADFYHQRFQILLCTTIVESGIDVPTANTIIIERADRFGLAQIHQLRGRVGRSHHQAYAYLFTPPKEMLTADARKRLDAISSLQDLGAGFALASHDLEIRGSGELLGESQSGHMQTIGFSLYMELLEKAMSTLKKGEPLSIDISLPGDTEIDLQIPALIPDAYIGDVHTRLQLYKRLAQAKNEDELIELRIEFVDRFGTIPQPADNLFTVTKIKLIAEKLGIKKIDANSDGAKIVFKKKPDVDPMKIIQLIQKYPHQYKLQGSEILRFSNETKDAAARINMVQDLLTKIS